MFCSRRFDIHGDIVDQDLASDCSLISVYLLVRVVRAIARSLLLVHAGHVDVVKCSVPRKCLCCCGSVTPAKAFVTRVWRQRWETSIPTFWRAGTDLTAVVVYRLQCE